MLDLTGKALDNIAISMIDAPIGTYRQSDLPEIDFAQISIGLWALCDGRSSAGSLYEQITGKATVPDMRGNGVNSFIKIGY